MDRTLKAFLALVAWSEGTSTSPLTQNYGYDVLVSGVDGKAVFTDYSAHPFSSRPPVVVRTHFYPDGRPLLSTAAGRYQIMLHNWHVYAPQVGFTDFSPACQDAIALDLIHERFDLKRITILGQIPAAILACSSIWASFPGNSYGQGGHTLTALEARYEALLCQQP